MNQQVPFHEQLIRERKRRGWSQEAIAKRLGIDPKTVGRWERKESLPTLKLQEELCRLFGKSAEEFGLLPPDNSEVGHVDVQQLTTEQQTDRSIGSSPSPPGRRLFPSLIRAMQGQTSGSSQPHNSNIEARIQTILRNNA